MSKKNSAAPRPAPSLLLFGVPPGRSRPVGARFAPEEAGIAQWLARHRRLRLVTSDTEPARRLAARLPAWQLKPDGSPVLSVLTAGLWEELRTLLPPEPAAPDPPAAPDAANGEAVAAERLAVAESLWAGLKVGDTVLAPEFGADGAPEGWWEATILALAGDSCTLCWSEDPDGGLRQRRRVDLALLHPQR